MWLKWRYYFIRLLLLLIFKSSVRFCPIKCQNNLTPSCIHIYLCCYFIRPPFSFSMAILLLDLLFCVTLCKCGTFLVIKFHKLDLIKFSTTRIINLILDVITCCDLHVLNFFFLIVFNIKLQNNIYLVYIRADFTVIQDVFVDISCFFCCVQQGSKVQTRVGLLMLLCTWINNCPIAVTHFLHNQENVPFVSLKHLGHFSLLFMSVLLPGLPFLNRK